MAREKQPVILSLISHTNVGKTALARTLLRKDVGEVADRAHVTVVSEAYTLIESDDAVAKLWDTPGFGSNLAKLASRLRSSKNPVGWILHQVWDRIKDQSLFCSQEAIRNIQSDADVVIYLVDASQSPNTIGYVDLEMEILTWIGKPVIVFMNQVGTPDPERNEADEKAWRDHLAKHAIVKSVSTLDAFTRCWIQEHSLLEEASKVLPDGKRKVCDQLIQTWINKNLAILSDVAKEVSLLMAESATDSEKLTEKSLIEKVKGFILNFSESDPELERIQQSMYARLATRTGRTINEIIKLHGLDGETARSLADTSREEFAVRRDVDESIATAVGGATVGLVGGLAADLAAGGMTFGGGAVVGAVLGGATTYALAKGYNLSKSSNNTVRWTEAHFLHQLEFVLMLYLGVAHFGRGRGSWQDPINNPAHWEEKVKELVHANKVFIGEIWKKAEGKTDPEKVARKLHPILLELMSEMIGDLYPEQAEVFLD